MSCSNNERASVKGLAAGFRLDTGPALQTPGDCNIRYVLDPHKVHISLSLGGGSIQSSRLKSPPGSLT